MSRMLDDDFVLLFLDLARGNEPKRLKAAAQIVNRLRSYEELHVQNVEEEKRDDDDDDDDDDDGDGSRKNSPIFFELKYTIKRLVTGLTSNRKAIASFGFFIALVEVLRTFKTIKAKSVLKMVHENVKNLNEDVKAKRERELINEALVYSVLIRSGITLKTAQMTLILEKLVACAFKNSNLELFCCSIVKELLQKVDEAKFASAMLPSLKILCRGWNGVTPFTLWLLLVTSELFPNVINRRFIQKYWESKSLLHEDNCKHLTKIMMQSTAFHPNVHPVCIEIVKNALKNSKLFTCIWLNVVDGRMSQAFNDKGKIYLTFELIKLSLTEAKKPVEVETILSPNILSCFVQILSQRHVLNEAAQALADYIVAFMKSCGNPAFQFAIMKQLTSRPGGTILFDRITKTKTISTALLHLKDEAIPQFTQFLINYITGIEKEVASASISPADADNQKRVAVQLLERLFTKTSLSDDVRQRNHVLKFLVLHAFFDIKTVDDEIFKDFSLIIPMSVGLRKALTDCFFHLLGQISKNVFSVKKPNTKDFLDLYYNIIEFCNLLLKSPDLATPVTVFDDETRENWDLVFELVKKLQSEYRNSTAKKLAENLIFQLFFLQLLLQLFINPKETIPFVEELQICCQKATLHDESDADSVDREPNWLQVVVDIVLSFLSRVRQQSFNYLTESVFYLLAPHLTVKAIQQILNVLCPGSSDDDEILIEDEADGEEDPDEMLKLESQSEDEKTSDDEDDEDEVSDEEETSNQSSSSDITDKKLLNAIDKNPFDQLDPSDIDLDKVDNSELERVDAALVEMFKMRKKLKLNREEAALTSFRLRCLNLLKVLVETYPTIPVITNIMIPILEVAAKYAYKKDDQNALFKKSQSVFKCILKQKHFESFVDSSEEPAFFGIWQRLLQMAEKVNHFVLCDNIAEASVLLIRCLRKWTRQHNPERISAVDNEIISCYRDVFKKYFDEKVSCRLHISFLMRFIKHFPQLASELTEELLSFAVKDGPRLFRKTEALRVLHNLLKLSSLNSWNEERFSSFLRLLNENIVMIIKNMQSGSEMKPSFSNNLFAVYAKFCSLFMKRTKKPLKLIPTISVLPIFESLSKAAQNQIRNLISEIPKPQKKAKKKNRKNKMVEETCIRNKEESESNENDRDKETDKEDEKQDLTDNPIEELNDEQSVFETEKERQNESSEQPKAKKRLAEENEKSEQKRKSAKYKKESRILNGITSGSNSDCIIHLDDSRKGKSRKDIRLESRVVEEMNGDEKSSCKRENSTKTDERKILHATDLVKIVEDKTDFHKRNSLAKKTKVSQKKAKPSTITSNSSHTPQKESTKTVVQLVKKTGAFQVEKSIQKFDVSFVSTVKNEKSNRKRSKSSKKRKHSLDLSTEMKDAMQNDSNSKNEKLTPVERTTYLTENKKPMENGKKKADYRDEDFTQPEIKEAKILLKRIKCGDEDEDENDANDPHEEMQMVDSNTPFERRRGRPRLSERSISSDAAELQPKRRSLRIQMKNEVK